MLLVLENCTLIIVLSLFANACGTSTPELGNPPSSPEPTATEFVEVPTLSQVGHKQWEGWRVPMPARKKITKRSSARIESASGEHIQTSVTEYAPTSNFIFVQEFPSSNDKDVLESKRLMLKLITEYSVKGNVFLYSIAAIGLTENDKSTGPVLIFALKDKDGDGRFETLITANDKIVVPSWVAQ